MGLEGPWPTVLALACILVGLLLVGVGLVVPLALAVAKAAFVGWAARATLRRFAAEKPEPPRGASTPSGPSPRPPSEGGGAHRLPHPAGRRGDRDYETEPQADRSRPPDTRPEVARTRSLARRRTAGER